MAPKRIDMTPHHYAALQTVYVLDTQRARVEVIPYKLVSRTKSTVTLAQKHRDWLTKRPIVVQEQRRLSEQFRLFDSHRDANMEAAAAIRELAAACRAAAAVNAKEADEYDAEAKRLEAENG